MSITFQELVERHLQGDTVNYTNTEALYLEKPFSDESAVRFGQPQFKNGGLLDDKRFFCTNAALADTIDAYLDGANPEDCAASEMVDHLLDVFGGDEDE